LLSKHAPCECLPGFPARQKAGHRSTRSSLSCTLVPGRGWTREAEAGGAQRMRTVGQEARRPALRRRSPLRRRGGRCGSQVQRSPAGDPTSPFPARGGLGLQVRALIPQWRFSCPRFSSRVSEIKGPLPTPLPSAPAGIPRRPCGEGEIVQGMASALPRTFSLSPLGISWIPAFTNLNLPPVLPSVLPEPGFGEGRWGGLRHHCSNAW
jgi:hypothetical protein